MGIKRVKYYKDTKYKKTIYFDEYNEPILKKMATNITNPKKVGAFRIKDYNFVNWLFNKWRI